MVQAQLQKVDCLDAKSVQLEKVTDTHKNQTGTDYEPQVHNGNAASVNNPVINDMYIHNINQHNIQIEEILYKTRWTQFSMFKLAQKVNIRKIWLHQGFIQLDTFHLRCHEYVMQSHPEELVHNSCNCET